MKQLFHHYTKWEDRAAGMWRDMHPVEEQELYKVLVEFMKDTVRFKKAMKRVVTEWKYCVEHNLTDLSKNRLAWLGQAAACIEMGAPEFLTRQAWLEGLTGDDRDRANDAAREIIFEWEDGQCKNENLKFQF